ncbi:MAG: hypothetical protein HYR67_02380 [Bacteroidetes bacterium]|nr:hypothetical protein [Bacteroidota bacterium]
MKTDQKIDYYILSLSQKTASLLKIHDALTEEIKDGVFPMSNVDDFEYSKSSRGNSFGFSLKNFEKDKSFVKKERFNHFLRQINENLKGYLNDECALMLAGTGTDRADFRRISDYNNLISGEISGSYNSKNFNQLKQNVINTLKRTLQIKL